MTKNWNRPMSEQSKTRVINGLIDMRRAGIYHAVYCDGDLLSVLLPVSQYRETAYVAGCRGIGYGALFQAHKAGDDADQEAGMRNNRVVSKPCHWITGRAVVQAFQSAQSRTDWDTRFVWLEQFFRKYIAKRESEIVLESSRT